MIDPEALLKVLQAAGLTVVGIKILDVDDPTAWVFAPPLEGADRQRAIDLLTDLLHPIEVPPPPDAVSQRALWLLFTADEYLALAKSADAAVVRSKAIMRASESFDPTAVWVMQFFSACVAAQILTSQRSDAIYLTVNPPV